MGFAVEASETMLALSSLRIILRPRRAENYFGNEFALECAGFCVI
jgi:hypothetical protein